MYLGIEDNGTVTGVSREHRSVDGLAVFIFFSKTVPQVAWCVLKSSMRTRVAGGVYRGRPQLADCVQYPGAGQRRLKEDGTPEVVPLFPSRFVSRLSQLRNYDYSAQSARNHD